MGLCACSLFCIHLVLSIDLRRPYLHVPLLNVVLMRTTRRPGILVLVNDTDWELEGEGEYALQDGDEIVFISTLHGG